MGYRKQAIAFLLLLAVALKSTLAFAPLMVQNPSRQLLAFLQSRNSPQLDFQTSLNNHSGNSNENGILMGLNELQTLLHEAVKREDFMEAGSLSDELFIRLHGIEASSSMSVEEKRLRRKHMSWKGLGAAPWLVDRLAFLKFTLPTSIQINTMKSVNKILNTTDDEIIEAATTLGERIERNVNDVGIVVSGSTGSGKTLSFLVPLLSTLSDSLFTRQRLRVSTEEILRDVDWDLVERISVVKSPVERSNIRKQNRAGKIATGVSLLTLGKSRSDAKGLLALIVVPTRDLGVQTAILLYELVGRRSIEKKTTDIRGKETMFKYKGPKGIRIGCVLDDEEAEFGLKPQTDIAITMPQYVGKLINDGDLIPSKLRVVVYDEADLALEETSSDNLTALFHDKPEDRDYSRLTFMVGASVTESLGNLMVRSRILPEDKSYIATATRHAPLAIETGLQPPASDNDNSNDANNNNKSVVFNNKRELKAALLKDLNACFDGGLIHHRVTVKDGNGLLVLTRLVRKELQDYEKRRAEELLVDAVERPRVVVFFPDEATATASISPLRDALWGEHNLCILLPKTGIRPLQMMEQFKNNKTTLMLATPNSVRGLDFPAVSRVYTLYLPMDDPREYVHLAGRVGRVGQNGSVRGSGGRVVSILTEEEAGKMKSLSESLGFEFTDLDVDFESLPAKICEDEDVELNDDGACRQDKEVFLGRYF